MIAPTKFEIDPAETFKRLAHAPIVEAAIQIQTRADIQWGAPDVLETLKEKLAEYPKIEAQEQAQLQLTFSGLKQTDQRSINLGWTGLRFRSEDGRYIALFSRDGFLFSRLQPYENWELFKSEALRVWRIFVELAKPATVPKLDLRFINRIVHFGSAESMNVGDYFRPSPVASGGLDLPLSSFFHHELLLVPGQPYKANIVRTVQPLVTAIPSQVGLILDIDVFTTESFDLEDDSLEHRLAEMRWLKNKIFFGTITQNALQSFA